MGHICDEHFHMLLEDKLVLPPVKRGFVVCSDLPCIVSHFSYYRVFCWGFLAAIAIMQMDVSRIKVYYREPKSFKNCLLFVKHARGLEKS